MVLTDSQFLETCSGQQAEKQKSNSKNFQR